YCRQLITPSRFPAAQNRPCPFSTGRPVLMGTFCVICPTVCSKRDSSSTCRWCSVHQTTVRLLPPDLPLPLSKPSDSDKFRCRGLRLCPKRSHTFGRYPLSPQ